MYPLRRRNPTRRLMINNNNNPRRTNNTYRRIPDVSFCFLVNKSRNDIVNTYTDRYGRRDHWSRLNIFICARRRKNVVDLYASHSGETFLANILLIRKKSNNEKRNYVKEIEIKTLKWYTLVNNKFITGFDSIETVRCYEKYEEKIIIAYRKLWILQ